MIANKAALLAVVVALAEQAQAFNSHRHLHNQVEKRAVEVEWFTVWETVYVTGGENDSKAKATDFVADGQPTHPVVKPTTTKTHHTKKTKHSTKTTSTATSTSTSTVAKPTTTSVPPPPPPPPTTTTQPAPAPTTTLATIAKPAVEKAPAKAPAVSVADVVTSVLAPVVAPTTTKVAPPAATTTKSSSSGSGSGSASSVGFSSKKGMAYNEATLANTFGAECKGCSWAWNWGSNPSGLDSSFSYVPMLWGPASDHTLAWDSDAEKALGKGAKALMSFNECDNAGQSNLDATTAAADHAQYMNKYKNRALIGAPSITNSNIPGQSIDWLNAFFKACEAQEDGCAVHFCSVHWYSPATAESTLFDFLDSAHKACGNKPIWLTEFAPTGTDEEINSFLQDAIPKLNKLDYLDAYSYFMVSTDSLMTSVSELATFGSTYADL